MKKETKFCYQQPILKVMEIKARQVLCQSVTGGITKMEIEEGESI